MATEVTMEQVVEAIEAPTAASDWTDNLERWDDLYACKRKDLTLELIDGTHKRYRRSLGMAKRVSEDWAGLLWTEAAGVDVAEEATVEADWLKLVFDRRFATDFTGHLERAFALGYGAVELLVEGLEVGGGGTITPTASATVRFDYIPASSVIPLKWNRSGVSEIAFVSWGKDYVDVREHRLEGTTRIITNRRFKSHGKDDKLSELGIEDLPEGVAPRIEMPGAPPLWAVTAPELENNLDIDSPFGVSVFANAEDHLDALDIIFDNFAEDFNLGGKMVFMSDTLLRRTADTNKIIAPQKDKANLFVALESDAGIEGLKTGIYEHNPTLRTEENLSGINGALSLVSSAVGMGESRYRYRGGQDTTAETATAVVSQNSDLFRNRRKHLLGVFAAVEALALAALWVADNLIGLVVDVDTEITVRADDSVIEDDGTRIARGMAKVQAGVMSVERYLIEYEKMDADKAAEEAAKLRPTIPPLFD